LLSILLAFFFLALIFGFEFLKMPFIGVKKFIYIKSGKTGLRDVKDILFDDIIEIGLNWQAINDYCLDILSFRN
jgi:hypothetical protein